MVFWILPGVRIESPVGSAEGDGRGALNALMTQFNDEQNKELGSFTVLFVKPIGLIHACVALFVPQRIKRP